MLDKREILDYIECTTNGKWYEPPISFDGLARSVRAAVHHSSPMYVKRNILASTFIPHRLLSQQEFSRYALDYLVFGNAYLEERQNMLGAPLQLKSSLAKYTRRGVERGAYWFVQNWKEAHRFKTDSVFHLIEPDINQELYGLSEYLSALNSAWLNEAATLFRRKYYQNGAHAGYILYMTDAAQSTSDVDRMRQAMRDTKGLGTSAICLCTRRTASKSCRCPRSPPKTTFQHQERQPRRSAECAPRTAADDGDYPEQYRWLRGREKAAQVFVRNELTPLQERMKEVNGWIGEEVIRFAPYELPTE